MQPYIFPYIGYFHLIHAVDKFVLYDDVAFIKQGWINRNNILLGGKKYMFSIPVKNISSFTTIKDTEISEKPFNWKIKLLNTIKQAYSKAPHFRSVYPLVEAVLLDNSSKSIAEMAKKGILAVLNYLSIEKEIVMTSTCYQNDHLRSTSRVLDICDKESATTYINVSGGQELYSKNDFDMNGKSLYFVKSELVAYKQFDIQFVQGLSIIDVLMFNSIEETHSLLTNYELI